MGTRKNEFEKLVEAWVSFLRVIKTERMKRAVNKLQNSLYTLLQGVPLCFYRAKSRFISKGIRGALQRNYRTAKVKLRNRSDFAVRGGHSAVTAFGYEQVGGCVFLNLNGMHFEKVLS
jgi:hypothetical protein